MNIAKNYVIETKRCRLKCASLEDIPYILSATRYEGFNDGMLWESPAKEEELIEPYENSIRAWENGESYTFSIESKDSKNFIGRISIRRREALNVWNIGFWTHPIYQSQGYMTECAQAVLDFGFNELKAEKIDACHALWNKASEKVLQKIGMTYIEYVPQGFMKKGEWVEENHLGISREDWQINKTRLVS